MGCFGSKVEGGAPAPPPHGPAPHAHEPDTTAQEDAAQLSIRSPTPRSAGGGPRTTHIRERLIHETHEDPLALFDSVKQLGSGVSGSVHLVRSKRTGLEYALKLLAKDMFSSDTFDQLMQEVQLLRELDHPHIVRLVEVFNLQDGVNLALLMEHLSGGELYNALQEQQDQRFSEESAKDIMRQLVSAVAFLHSQGIVHRDLKLENFLFTKRPSDGGTVVKLIDLGLSRRYGTGERTLTGALVIRRMHSVVGTPYYIAPEILAEADTSGGAKRGYDHLVDSWSLGVIAYMLISGTPPFAGSRDNEVLSSVMKGKFTLQGKRWEGVSESCKDFVRQLLVFRPEHRMTAAAAAKHSWLASLTAKLEGQPLAETLPSGFLPNLRYFQGLGGWKKAALEAVAFSCPDAQVEHLRGAFERMDKKGHGYLTEEDFSAALATLGVSVEESSALFKDVSLGDADGIHWNSFIAAVMPRSILTQERLQEAFDALDVQRLGYLTEDSFKDVMAGDAEALDEGDSIASLFRGSERVDFAAFSEAFFRENSPEGAAVGGGGGGGSVSSLVLPPAACPGGRQRTASSMFFLGSLASPAREATSSSRRLASIFVSPAGGGVESFPLGLPSSVGATRTPAVSGVAAQSRAEGFAPAGILSPVVPAPPA